MAPPPPWRAPRRRQSVCTVLFIARHHGSAGVAAFGGSGNCTPRSPFPSAPRVAPLRHASAPTVAGGDGVASTFLSPPLPPPTNSAPTPPPPLTWRARRRRRSRRRARRRQLAAPLPPPSPPPPSRPPLSRSSLATAAASADRSVGRSDRVPMRTPCRQVGHVALAAVTHGVMQSAWKV